MHHFVLECKNIILGSFLELRIDQSCFESSTYRWEQDRGSTARIIDIFSECIMFVQHADSCPSFSSANM